MLSAEPGEVPQRLNQKLVAGLFDAGLSSTASFVVGIIAIRTLSPSDLGVYSVLFSAFLLGSLVPSEAFFYPRQVTAIRYKPAERTDGIGRAMVGSLGHAVIGSSAVLIAALLIRPHADLSLLIPEALAAAGLVMASPAQDYLRRSLHLSEQSWKAMAVSAGQLVFVLVLAGGAFLSRLAIAGLPLAILFAANCLSILLGLSLTGVKALRRQFPVDRAIRGVHVFRSAAFSVGAGLVGSLIVARLAGPEVVGYAEAARTAAQPVLVVGMGLIAALASRSLTAIDDRDWLATQHVSRVFHGFMALATFGFLILYSLPWSVSLLRELMPAAFDIPGLAVISVIANFLMASSGLRREQLLAARLERQVANSDTLAATLPIVVAFFVPWLGAFARGVGLAAQCAFRLVGYRRQLGTWFRPSQGDLPS